VGFAAEGLDGGDSHIQGIGVARIRES
jgi:hypothetical protein